MIGLTCLEVYTSFFNMTEDIDNFDIYTPPSEKEVFPNNFSYEFLIDVIEKDSKFSLKDLKHDLILWKILKKVTCNDCNIMNYVMELTHQGKNLF